MTDHRTGADRHRTLLYLGLAIQAVLAVLPLLDLLTLDTVTGHVQRAYPDWDAGDVALDRNAIAWSLAGIGVLGCIGWLIAIAVDRRGGPARAVTTVLFGLGLLTSLTVLSTGGENYDLIVPLGYGLLGLLPVLAGAGAVAAAWRGRRAALP